MTEKYSLTNPFAPMHKPSFDAPDDDQVVDERPDYVEPETDTTQDDDSAVPTGSAKEVMDWVGDDKDRAQTALDAEEAKGENGRKGLKKDLAALLEN